MEAGAQGQARESLGNGAIIHVHRLVRYDFRTLPKEQSGVRMGLLAMLNFIAGAVSKSGYSMAVLLAVMRRLIISSSAVPSETRREDEE